MDFGCYLAIESTCLALKLDNYALTQIESFDRLFTLFRNFLFTFFGQCSKGAFYSEIAGEMWNRLIKVPKNAPELLFPINGMNCSDEILIF